MRQAVCGTTGRETSSEWTAKTSLRSTSVTALAHAGDLCVTCFEAQHFER